jgi:hypothetical protein
VLHVRVRRHGWITEVQDRFWEKLVEVTKKRDLGSCNPL